jgi:hypothetical protein
MPTVCLTDIAECVNAVPREKDDCAWPDFSPSLPNEETISTLDDDEDLIVAPVDMRRRPASRRYYA